MRNIKIGIFISILLISIFSLLSTKFVYKVAAQDSTQNIIITEIAAHEPSNLEWIEIFNTTDQDIDITNLILFENDTNHSVTPDGILPAKSYALIVNKIDEISFENENNIYDSSWSSLNQSGEILQLILNDTIQDSVNYPEFTQSTSLERVHLNQEYTDQWLHHPNSNSALQINHNQIQEQEICTEETITLLDKLNQESQILFNNKNLDPGINLESEYKVKLKAFSHNKKLLLTEFLTIEKILTETKTNSELPLIIILTILAIAGIVFKNKIITFLKNNQIWHNAEN